MLDSATFITMIESGPPGAVRLAVKDLIDIAGYQTSAGSRVVAEGAKPAAIDAACMAGARARNVRIVGKTNLVELALGVSGINPWFGTPENPIDPRRIPGGSSSGSAVAVATGGADVAFGSDTGGSIRIPAGCCGVVGLKTTFGRIPLDGVRPLAPSLDTVGPMARTVAETVMGMELLEPGFLPAGEPPKTVGRLRLEAAGWIDEAIDVALARAGFAVNEIEIPEWFEAWEAAKVIIEYEAAQTNTALISRRSELDPLVAGRLERGAAISVSELTSARRVGEQFKDVLEAILARHQLIALPTLAALPALIADGPSAQFPYHSPVNLAGLPALAMPVGPRSPFPASLQLIGASNGEELLLAAAAAVEVSDC